MKLPKRNCSAPGSPGAEMFKRRRKNIRDAIRECLEVRKEKGLPLTVTTHYLDVAV